MHYMNKYDALERLKSELCMGVFFKQYDWQQLLSFVVGHNILNRQPQNTKLGGIYENQNLHSRKLGESKEVHSTPREIVS